LFVGRKTGLLDISQYEGNPSGNGSYTKKFGQNASLIVSNVCSDESNFFVASSPGQDSNLGSVFVPSFEDISASFKSRSLKKAHQAAKEFASSSGHSNHAKPDQILGKFLIVLC
jgi:hypothetical protein